MALEVKVMGENLYIFWLRGEQIIKLGGGFARGAEGGGGHYEGKISEDLKWEYVSLNHIIATKVQNEEFGNRFSKIKMEKVLVNI